MKSFGIVAMTCLTFLTSGCAARLAQFGATPDAAAPYQEVASYYGYVAPGTQPDETRQNRKTYYVYVWLPSGVPELGVRVVSPTKDLPQAEGQMFRQTDYTGNADGKEFFDPAVLLERCTTINNPREIGQTCAAWARLGENDDSNELPDQPSGRKTNALLRVTSNNADANHALMRGLYRVGLSDAKRGEVNGTYLLQLGTPVQLSGIAIGRTLDEVRQLAR